MKLTKLKQFDPNTSENINENDKSKSEWYMSCGLLFLFFLGLSAALFIIFTVFGKIIFAMFMTDL